MCLQLTSSATLLQLSLRRAAISTLLVSYRSSATQNLAGLLPPLAPTARFRLLHCCTAAHSHDPHSSLKSLTIHLHATSHTAETLFLPFSLPPCSLQLIDTVLINPTVHLAPSYRDTGLTATYTFEPLSNLVYTRDQQITTCKGIVMGRLRSQQRQREVRDRRHMCCGAL
jgi:hypothetical protein